MRTPHQILGPFFPQGLKPATQEDLTIVEGVDGHAQGEIVEVTGRVLDEKGKPVPDARLTIWQANTLRPIRASKRPQPCAAGSELRRLRRYSIRQRWRVSHQDREAWAISRGTRLDASPPHSSGGPGPIRTTDYADVLSGRTAERARSVAYVCSRARSADRQAPSAHKRSASDAEIRYCSCVRLSAIQSAVSHVSDV